MTDHSPFSDPVLPIEWQAKEAQGHMALAEANVLRWICGAPITGDPITRRDIESLGYTIVKKEADDEHPV